MKEAPEIALPNATNRTPDRSSIGVIEQELVD